MSINKVDILLIRSVEFPITLEPQFYDLSLISDNHKLKKHLSKTTLNDEESIILSALKVVCHLEKDIEKGTASMEMQELYKLSQKIIIALAKAK